MKTITEKEKEEMEQEIWDELVDNDERYYWALRHDLRACNLEIESKRNNVSGVEVYHVTVVEKHHRGNDTRWTVMGFDVNDIVEEMKTVIYTANFFKDKIDLDG